MSQAQTEVIMHALSFAAKLAANGQNQRHSEAVMQLRAGAMRDIVEAVVTRRVDAVQQQCQTVLEMYAEQAKSYLTEKRAIDEKFLQSRDVITRLELRSRLNEIDAQLAEIRADAKLVYDRMCDVILSIGGPGMTLPGDLSGSLGLVPR